MDNVKNICAIIITYNPNYDLIKGIKAILKQVDEVILVDNGSSNEKVKFLEDVCEENKITLINNLENLGIAKALNIGIKKANENKNKYKWILTLDQDSIVTEDMIKKMLDRYEAQSDKENIMMLVPEHIEKGRDFDNLRRNDEIKYVLTEIASGNLIKNELFNKIGLFEEKLFIDLVDHDFCLKINEKGFKILKVYEAVLLHSLGETQYNKFLWMTISSSNHSALRRYYMARNRIYIWKKYKKSYSQWVKEDKKMFLSEIIRIILFENKKNEKIKMILLGLRDGKNELFGKYNGGDYV